MRRAIKMTLAAAAFMAVGSAANAGNIVVHNKTSKPVWVTVYSLVKTHITSYCLKSGRDHTTNMSGWAQANTGGAIYIRYEYKNSSNCGGGTSYDSHYGTVIGYPASGDINQWVPAH